MLNAIGETPVQKINQIIVKPLPLGTQCVAGSPVREQNHNFFDLPVVTVPLNFKASHEDGFHLVRRNDSLRKHAFDSYCVKLCTNFVPAHIQSHIQKEKGPKR